MNVGASYSDTLNKEKNEHKDKTTLTTSFSTGMTYERTKTLATLGQGNINITDKENSDDLARLNTDTTQVDKSLIKTSMGTKVDATLDTRLLTEDGRKEIKNETKELVQSPGKAYDTMFVQTADVYIVEQDGTSRKLTESEKSNFIQSSDGKVHIATNGIFNDQMAAAKYAAQHSSSEGAQYVVYFPQADNAVSELLVAGYQKFLEGDTIGLTNATQEIKNLTNKYGQEGLQLDGHSRGSLTIGNALDSIATQPNAQGSLSNTTINFFGPAQNVLNADEQLSYLQNRDAATNLDTKNNMVIHYMNNAADPVGTYIGGNAPTGGTIPQTEPITTTIVSGIPVSNANTNLNEMVRAGTGQANTSHNSYGNAKQESLDSFWGGKTPNLTPIRTYTK